jgi:FtsP/CotA-like multicopper oxidase with cupredoxin domain
MQHSSTSARPSRGAGLKAQGLIGVVPWLLLAACGDDAPAGETDAAVDVATDAGDSTEGSDTSADTDILEPTDVRDPLDVADTDAAEVSDSGPDGCIELGDGSCVVETFVNPPVLAPDENGDYNLSLAPTEVVLDGERHCVRAYNGGFVGPTIDTPARSGDEQRSIRVNLVNRLEDHDLHSLAGGSCTCTYDTGVECDPESIHDSCAPHGEDPACLCVDEEGEPCEHMFDFNTTNLHAHGSHIRPDFARGGEACEPFDVDGVTVQCRDCDADVCDGDDSDNTCFNGDNVLNQVHPSEGAQYRWDIDEDGTHHTGMQWYHPHIHGTTAIQVASGAAGAWLVRGELDSLAGVAEAKERVILFSTAPLAGDGAFEPLEDGEACTDETITFNNFATLGAVDVQQVNIINGERRPRMLTAPGQVERWRILHTGFLDEVFLGLFRGTDNNCSEFSTADEDTIRLTQIARDGLILPQSFEGDYVFMSPGYRVEAFLGGEGNLDDGDTWCLVAARFLQEADPAEFGSIGGMPFSPLTPPTAEEIHARFDTNGDVVAILNVTSNVGTASTTALPDYDAIAALAPDLNVGGVDIDDRCAAAAAAESSDDVDQLAVLQVGYFTTDDPDPCDCEAYNVNCNNFESTDRSRYAFDRDLELGAIDHWRVGASFDGHPFHIHINPYIVCPNDNIYDPIPFAHWRDTYLVNVGRQVDLISENRAFTGPFVFHCHKLTHEDEGMMELIRVCDPAEDATCGDYAWDQCDADDLACTQALEATRCYIDATSPAEIVACVGLLGGPAGVCGANACATDDDCAPVQRCDEHVCVVGPR